MNKKFIIMLFFVLLMGAVSAEEISISSMSIKDKIAQVVIVRGDDYNSGLLDLGVGGIFLSKQKAREEYKNLIEKYQENSRIKLLVSTDMEGYWNPFDDFYKSKNFGEVKDEKEAYELGKEHGKLLEELGFNFDFSPVVEPSERNYVWPGRSFIGQDEEIKKKIESYVKGLEEGEILSTAKHYPGGSMLKDPHIKKVKAEIYESDLHYFDHAIKNEIDAIMIGHPVVYGVVDSKGKQSTISPEVIFPLRKKFDGLIVSDAIQMGGLSLSYVFSFNRVYVDLIKAGNDLVIDFPTNYFPWSKTDRKIKKRIEKVVKAVEEGEISEKRIDESVRRILEKKGYVILE